MALDEENKVVETDDPNILAESKKQIVNPINRKDVEYIAKKIVEQSGGGDTPTPGGGGLEVIEWDGERDVTAEEYQKLVNFQAVLKYNSSESDSTYYIPTLIDTDGVTCFCVQISFAGGTVLQQRLIVYNDYSVSYSDDYVKTTKLYNHHITLNSDKDFISFVNTSETPIQYNGTFGFLTKIEEIFENSISSKFNFQHQGYSKIKGLVTSVKIEQNSTLYVGTADFDGGTFTDSINVADIGSYFVDTVTEL